MTTTEPTYDFANANWAPLRLVLPVAEAGMFMWMHAVIYEDGFRLEAYKHRITRQYLFLEQHGHAYVASPDGLELVDVRVALGAIGDDLERLGWPRDATSADELDGLDGGSRRHSPTRRRRRC